MDLDIKNMATRAVEEKPLDRRSLLFGSGALAALAAIAMSGNNTAYAEEVVAGAASGIAASAGEGDAGGTGADSASGGSNGGTDGASNAANLTTGSSSALRSGNNGLLGSGNGSSSTDEWQLADPDLTDEVLQRLSDAEAENAQLRSDIAALQALLTPDGRIPREVYVQTTGGVTPALDTYPSVILGADLSSLYFACE